MDKSKIKIMGRYWEEADGSIKFMTACGGFQFNAECEGEVKIKINIHNIPIFSAYFMVLINGEEKEISYGETGEVWLTLAVNLPKGKYLFEVYETQGQRFSLCDIELCGEILPPPENKKLFIETIGDSIAAGADNMGLPGRIYNEDRTQNAYRTYATRVALAFDADWTNFAMGGCSCSERTDIQRPSVPSAYPFISSGLHEPYDFKRKPDLIHINLGTNDWFFLEKCYEDYDEKKAIYKAALEKFTKLIFELNGEVPILYSLGFMTPECYLNDAMKELSEQFSAAGHTVKYLKIPQMQNGANGHPSCEDNRIGAEMMIDFIKENNLL